MFQIISSIVEKYPIVAPIATLIGIITIITAIIFNDNKMGEIGIAVFSGVNLAIVYSVRNDISINDFFTFLFSFIFIIALGVILLPKLNLASSAEITAILSLGLSVAPMLISIRVMSQIKNLRK